VVYGGVGNFGIAGGSDSYGYVSQADLWLSGRLKIDQPDVRRAPWPSPEWTFSPLGYRPSADRNSIVPVYSPGLPMIMAVIKRVAGQCAIRLIVPVCGGLLLAATFLIGRRLFSDQIGVAATWLLATSPVFLMMLLQPMSDVPVAAFWALAVYGCLTGSVSAALAAGLFSAIAILIRPNLFHVGIVMGAWILVRDFKERVPRLRVTRTVAYGFPAAAACVIVALINKDLYGSATSSGYGPLKGLYSLHRGPVNLAKYGWWLIETQTPLGLMGLLALFLPASIVAPPQRFPARGLLVSICLSVVGSYLFWLVFDAWWYLRFLLVCWPSLCIAAAWLLTWPSGRTFRAWSATVIVCVGLYGLWFAERKGTFDFNEGERRYVKVARLVRDATSPDSVVFSIQHSGSVRYYGGRTTLRYDYLSERWLDRAVAWLTAHGKHPYFLLDEWEVPAFQARFGRDNVLGRLQLARVWEYRGNPAVFLYDPLQPARIGERPMIVSERSVRIDGCPVPEAPPRFVVKE